MLFLTNLLIVTGFMAVLVAYIFGVIALAEWAGEKWGLKGFNAIFGALLFLPLTVIFALGLTYGA